MTQDALEQTATQASTAAQALAAAGDTQSAQDVSALDSSALGAQKKLGTTRSSLVERLIYGPLPQPTELQSGTAISKQENASGKKVVDAAMACLSAGTAFEGDRRLSKELRATVASEKAYGFTVPVEYGGAGASYPELALTEEELSVNGLGALAVEISGELTIGAGSLLAYGTSEQKSTYLPMIAEGQLMGFGLTEVGVGVNAKKVQAYVELDEANDCYRLHATGPRNKLWITNATHGGLVGLVARIGKGGKKVGLFVTHLPESDVTEADGKGYEFWCRPTRSDAFMSNFNTRLSFDNFPIPRQNEIQADGVEVLFYCLRMGRCMLASMSAGYQRMFAKDAAHYATQRVGVGGKVIKHELPRLNLGTILGGALQSRALSHLSLKQDADGVDLAGLRDLTKSAASCTANESLIACERVLGGRSFDNGSRVSEARPNVHVFGIVEGEDNLILMGMVKDITAKFTDQYMAGMLGVISSINLGPDGKPVDREKRILKIMPGEMLKHPIRCATATMRLLGNKSFWGLKAWIIRNAIADVLRLPGRLIPTALLPRYSSLPKGLRGFARYAERKLRQRRWTYLGLNLFFQLELTRAQIPLQRFGKTVEHLTSILVLCHHASQHDESQQRVARLQCQLLKNKFEGIPILSGLFEMQRTRDMIADVGTDIEKGKSSLLDGVEAQPFAHDWE